MYLLRTLSQNEITMRIQLAVNIYAALRKTLFSWVLLLSQEHALQKAGFRVGFDLRESLWTLLCLCLNSSGAYWQDLSLHTTHYAVLYWWWVRTGKRRVSDSHNIMVFIIPARTFQVAWGQYVPMTSLSRSPLLHSNKSHTFLDFCSVFWFKCPVGTKVRGHLRIGKVAPQTSLS